MRYPKLPFLLLILFMATSLANGQNLETSVSVDSVTIGDRFNLIVVIGHDGTRDAVFPHDLLPDSLGPQPAFGLGDFEILGVIRQGGRPYDLGGRIDSVVYEATTFALDTARVAGIPVGLASLSDTLFSMAPPVELIIGSLVPEDAQDIKDLAELAVFERSIWPWVLGGLALLAVAYGLWWWKKSRAVLEDGAGASAEPQTPPYDEAVDRLSALQSMDLSDPENVKPFYVELTDILRTYVGRRVHVPALETTTRELLSCLRESTAGNVLSQDIVKEIDEVLSHSDLVKFADLKPILEQSRAMVAETRDAIEGTETAFLAEEERVESERLAMLEAERYAPSTPETVEEEA